MTKPLVIVSVPAGEFVHTRFMESLIALQGFTLLMGSRMIEGGLVAGVNVVHGSILQISRTSLVEAALEGNATHVLFLDSDMMFPHDTLIRLLKHDKDIVGANYPTKSVPAKPTSEALDHTPLHTREHDTGLVEAFYVATGCMLVKTEVFARLPTPWFQTPFAPAHNSFMTEDVYFCAKARDIGIEVWCDQDLSKEVAHIGAHFYRMSDVPGWTEKFVASDA